jgi:hypothetical protein
MALQEAVWGLGVFPNKIANENTAANTLNFSNAATVTTVGATGLSNLTLTNLTGNVSLVGGDQTLAAGTSDVASGGMLDRMRVNRARAKSGRNVRVVQHASGAVIIPHESDFPAMTLHDGENLSGASIPLKCYVEYNRSKLGKLRETPASFLLKRGYMATIAENENGTGASRNDVAQDHDVVINTLPSGHRMEQRCELDQGTGPRHQTTTGCHRGDDQDAR